MQDQPSQGQSFISHISRLGVLPQDHYYEPSDFHGGTLPQRQLRAFYFNSIAEMFPRTQTYPQHLTDRTFVQRQISPHLNNSISRQTSIRSYRAFFRIHSNGLQLEPGELLKLTRFFGHAVKVLPQELTLDYTPGYFQLNYKRKAEPFKKAIEEEAKRARRIEREQIFQEGRTRAQLQRIKKEKEENRQKIPFLDDAYFKNTPQQSQGIINQPLNPAPPARLAISIKPATSLRMSQPIMLSQSSRLAQQSLQPMRPMVPRQRDWPAQVIDLDQAEQIDLVSPEIPRPRLIRGVKPKVSFASRIEALSRRSVPRGVQLGRPLVQRLRQIPVEVRQVHYLPGGIRRTGIRTTRTQQQRLKILRSGRKRSQRTVIAKYLQQPQKPKVRKYKRIRRQPLTLFEQHRRVKPKIPIIAADELPPDEEDQPDQPDLQVRGNQAQEAIADAALDLSRFANPPVLQRTQPMQEQVQPPRPIIPPQSIDFGRRLVQATARQQAMIDLASRLFGRMLNPDRSRPQPRTSMAPRMVPQRKLQLTQSFLPQQILYKVDSPSKQLPPSPKKEVRKSIQSLIVYEQPPRKKQTKPVINEPEEIPQSQGHVEQPARSQPHRPLPGQPQATPYYIFLSAKLQGIEQTVKPFLIDAMFSWNKYQYQEHQRYIRDGRFMQARQQIMDNIFLYDPPRQHLLIGRNDLSIELKSKESSILARGGSFNSSVYQPIEKALFFDEQSRSLSGPALESVLYSLWAMFNYSTYVIKICTILSDHINTGPIRRALQTLENLRVAFSQMPVQISFQLSTISAFNSKVFAKKFLIPLDLSTCLLRLWSHRRKSPQKMLAAIRLTLMDQFIKFWSQTYVIMSRQFNLWITDHVPYVQGQDQRPYVLIKNVYISTWGIPVSSLIVDFYLLNQPWPLVIETMRKFRDDPQQTRVRQILRWDFYVPKSSKKIREFPVVQRQCIAKTSEQLMKVGYPNPGFTRYTRVADVTQYCERNRIDFRLIGFPDIGSYRHRSQGLMVIAPKHLQFYPIREKIHAVRQDFGTVVRYKTQDQLRLNQKLLVDSRQYPLLGDWVIGKQLPLDPKLDNILQRTLRYRCLVIDIQCLSVVGSMQHPYLLCCVGYPLQNSPIETRSFTQTQYQYFVQSPDGGVTSIQGTYQQASSPIDNFVDWLLFCSESYTKDDPLIVWGYNLMGYQMNYLVPVLARKCGFISPQGPLGDCKTVSICQGKVMFADVAKLIQVDQLRVVTRDYQVVIPKKQFDIVKYKTIADVCRDFQVIREYCYYDCVSTLLLLHKIQCTFMEISKKQGVILPPQVIRQRYTSSSIGVWFFIHIFFKRSIVNYTSKTIDQQKTFCNNEPLDVYRRQRLSFFGGIVQVFRHQYKKRLYYVDVNSMYPTMLRRKLPWRYRDTWLVQSQYQLQQFLKQPQSDLYLFDVDFYQLPDDFKGAFIPTKQGSDSKNTYFNSYSRQTCDQPCYLHGADIKRLLYHCGQVHCVSVDRYTSQGQDSMKRFADTLYQRRRQVKNNKALKNCLKLLMNSLIGRLAMSQKTKYDVGLYPTTDEYCKLTPDIYVSQYEAQLPQIGRLVRLTSMTTSYARIYLDQLAQKAGYDNVCYCDTDSLIVTQQGYRNLGSPSTQASQLGDFKCETHEAGYNYYESGYFFNRKSYMLLYHDKEGRPKYLYKAKGIPKKFIDQTFAASVLHSYQACKRQLLKVPYDTVIPLYVSVDMIVWRRTVEDDCGGITLQHMKKMVNITVDRLFTQRLDQVGLPRKNLRIIPVGVDSQSQEQRQFNTLLKYYKTRIE